jgi:hypothetical protein
VYDNAGTPNSALPGASKHFSYKASRGEYHIAIGPLTGDAFRAADLFEKGRILLGHLEREKDGGETAALRTAPRTMFERALCAKRSTLLSFLPDDAGRRLSFYTGYLWKQFVETAQRIEIETKLFDNYASARAFALEPGLNWKTYLRSMAENPAVSLPLITGGKGALSPEDVSSFYLYREDAPENDGAAEPADPLVPMDKRGRTLHRSAPGGVRGAVTRTALQRLPEILRERSLLPQKTRTVTDLFYYANRRKYDTGFLVPRRLKREKTAEGNVVILLDVSGSIPAVFADAAVSAIIAARDTFDREHSRLVRWSANLVDDSPLFGIEPVSGGGGTVLAGGIDYCKRYVGDDSAFFIISDVQDEIAAWIESAKTMNARKTVIAYNKEGGDMSVEAWFSRAGSNADYRKEEVSLAEWSRHFDTLLVTL